MKIFVTNVESPCKGKKTVDKNSMKKKTKLHMKNSFCIRFEKKDIFVS